MVVGLAAATLVDPRPFGALAVGAAAACRACSGSSFWCCRGSSRSTRASATQFLIDSVGQDMLAKVASPQETHGAPPGLYFVLFFVTFFPGFDPGRTGGAGGLGGAARSRRARFLLAWLVPSWIVFEAGRHQAAALRAAALSGDRHPDRRRGRVAGAVAAAVAGARRHVVVPGAGDRQHHRGRRRGHHRTRSRACWPGRSSPPRSSAACSPGGCTITTAPSARSARRGRGSVLMAIGIYAVVVPSLEPAVSERRRWREVLARVRRAPHPLAASAGYEEPSLVFLAGTKTHLTDAAGAADFLRHGGCRFAFVEARQERAFALRAEAIGLRYDRGRASRLSTSASASRSRSRSSHRRARREREAGCSGAASAGGTTRRSAACANTLSEFCAIAVRRALSAPPRARTSPLPPSVVHRYASSPLAVVIASMFVLRRRGERLGARRLPRWFIEAFRADHRFRTCRAGFSVPFGFVFVCSCRGRRRRRCRAFAQACSRRSRARFGFLFLAIGAAGPVRHHRQAPDRPRPAVRRRPRRSVPLQPFNWRPAYASMPSGHATTAFAAAVAIGALWPRSAAADVDLRASRSCSAASSYGASSERRDRRRARRRGRRAPGAALVCGAPAGVLPRDLRPYPGPSLRADQGRCAERRRRAASLTRLTRGRLNSAWMSPRSIAACRTATELPTSGRHRWSCRCATRPAISRRWWPRSPRRWPAAPSRSSMSTTARPTAPSRNCAA